MKQDKIYISGPISSRPLGVAINHFTLAEAKLQAMGYRTCNPLKMRLCVWLAQHGHYRLCLWTALYEQKREETSKKHKKELKD